MGENIQGKNFLSGSSPGGNSPEGSLISGNFPGGGFLIPRKICAKNSLVYTASMFRPPPIIIFSYGVEIFPHPLEQLIAHVSALVS